MVDNNDALFREVDEELRREQAAKLWQRYGNYILGVAALIVATVGGYKYYEGHKLAGAQAAGSTYEAAMALVDAGKADEAQKALENIGTTGPAGYAALAELSRAGSYLKAGKRQEALQVFDTLAASSSADPLLSGFARLQAAGLRLGEADFTEMQNRLKPLTSEESPWRYLAKEYLGTAAVKAGKLDEARATLSPLLSDPLLPGGAAERIRRVMDIIAQAELASGKAPTATTAPGEAKSAPAP